MNTKAFVVLKNFEFDQKNSLLSLKKERKYFKGITCFYSNLINIHFKLLLF